MVFLLESATAVMDVLDFPGKSYGHGGWTDGPLETVHPHGPSTESPPTEMCIKMAIWLLMFSKSRGLNHPGDEVMAARPWPINAPELQIGVAAPVVCCCFIPSITI